MKYLLALISEEGGMEDASPEEMKAAMDRWDAYTTAKEAMIEHTDTDYARGRRSRATTRSGLASTRCGSS